MSSGANKTIHPTHTCFDDALELMHDILKFACSWAPEDQTHLVENLYLVHAIIGPGGQETSHAWVEHEEDDVVYVVGLVDGERAAFACPRKEYYRVHNVGFKTRYTYAEAFAENRRTGTFGPWLPLLEELCGNGVALTELEAIPMVRISE